ncbi:MAG: flagellar hook-basal body complex protein FliE [Pontixanthobacter sp.]
MSGVGGVGGAAGGVQDIIALRQQIIDKSSAIQSLREEKPADGADKTAGGGFADTLQSALGSVNASQARSSEMQAGYVRGEVTDVAQVMLARQEAGVAFEATLQVRNKLLSAYQDIMRMGV